MKKYFKDYFKSTHYYDREESREKSIKTPQTVLGTHIIPAVHLSSKRIATEIH